MLDRARFIAARDLGMLLKKQETLMWVFVMPLVFFYFIGTVSGGGGMSGKRKDRIALIAAADAGFLADDLAARLAKLDYDVVRNPKPEDAPSLSLELPANFTERVLAGEQQKLALATDDDSNAADLHQVRLMRAIYGLVADLAVSTGSSEPFTATTSASIAALPRNLTIDVTQAGKRKDPPQGFDQTVPGTMVMFTMIVLLTSGAVLIVIERQLGLLRRLASSPISRGELVLGKWGARVSLGLVQISFAMIAGRVLFHVNWGPSVPMVIACLFAWAALCASLALLLGSLARTTGQAVAIGVLTSNVMAALGGCWWPIEITPRWMQKLALCLPTGWTMDAMHRLVTFQNGALDALPNLCALLVAALVVGFAASRVFRYQ